MDGYQVYANSILKKFFFWDGLTSSDTTSEARSEEQVHTSPIPDEETRTRGREGPRTAAGVAISARDMSVGEGTFDHHGEMFHTGY